MSYDLQDPGSGFKRYVPGDLPVAHARKIYLPSGDVTFTNNKGEVVTVIEAELDAVNNQPILFNEITSTTAPYIYITK